MVEPAVPELPSLTASTLHEIALDRALELPATVLEQPFGPGAEVVKVLGKMFLLAGELHGEPMVVLKAAPRDAEMMRENVDGISPGYHMNKRHWITLNPGGALSEDFVRELVTDSYLLVVETLPRARRPVDPQTFLAAEGGTGTSSTDGPAT